MGAGWRFWWQCSHHVAALLSLTLSLWFFFFLILSSDCSITGRGSGGLDGHDFSAGPQTSLSHLPTVEPPSQSLCTLLSARHKPGGQNPTAKTLVVIPPTGGTKSSSPITTLETWRCLPLGDRDSLLSTARRLDGPELNFLSSGSTLPCDPSSLPLMVTGCDRGSAFEERTFTFCEGYSPVTFLCFFFFFFFLQFYPQFCGALGSVWGFHTVGIGSCSRQMCSLIPLVDALDCSTTALRVSRVYEPRRSSRDWKGAF